MLPNHPEFEEYFQLRQFAEWQRKMVSCRCSDRNRAEQKEVQMLLETANLPQRFGQDKRTFQNFQQSQETAEAYDACVQYAKKLGASILVLNGPRGCGKTHLVEATARACLSNGESVRYEEAIDLLDKIRATYSEMSQTPTDGLLEEYRKVSLLIIDDLGAEKSSEWAEERMLALVDERYRNGRRLIVATNEALDKAEKSRIWSRLLDISTGVARQIVMAVPSFRTGRKW